MEEAPPILEDRARLILDDVRLPGESTLSLMLDRRLTSKQQRLKWSHWQLHGQTHMFSSSCTAHLYIYLFFVTMEICHVTFWDWRVPHSLHQFVQQLLGPAKHWHSKISTQLTLFLFGQILSRHELRLGLQLHDCDTFKQHVHSNGFSDPHTLHVQSLHSWCLRTAYLINTITKMRTVQHTTTIHTMAATGKARSFDVGALVDGDDIFILSF